MVKGLFRPHYMTWSEQAKIEKHGTRVPEECDPDHHGDGPSGVQGTCLMRKEQMDLANKVVFIADSKTPTGVAEVPLTDIAVTPSGIRSNSPAPGLGSFQVLQQPDGAPDGLQKDLGNERSGRPASATFRLYDLRSTYATRLSAGGVADEWVTQMLRQTDAQGFQEVLADEAPDETGGTDEAQPPGQRRQLIEAVLIR